MRAEPCSAGTPASHFPGRLRAGPRRALWWPALESQGSRRLDQATSINQEEQGQMEYIFKCLF